MGIRKAKCTSPDTQSFIRLSPTAQTTFACRKIFIGKCSLCRPTMNKNSPLELARSFILLAGGGCLILTHFASKTLSQQRRWLSSWRERPKRANRLKEFVKRSLKEISASASTCCCWPTLVGRCHVCKIVLTTATSDWCGEPIIVPATLSLSLFALYFIPPDSQYIHLPALQLGSVCLSFQPFYCFPLTVDRVLHTKLTKHNRSYSISRKERDEPQSV